MAEEKRDSYTRLFNPILEALCRTEFTGRELRVVLFIIRATYGWNKKKFPLSKSYIMKGTGISERNVCRIIKKLISRKILLDYGIDKTSRSRVYGLNKKYSQWDAMSVTDDSVTDDTLCLTNEDHESVTDDRDMSVTDDTQKRHIKDKLKEKEKKCSQNLPFLDSETGKWVMPEEGSEEGENDEVEEDENGDI